MDKFEKILRDKLQHHEAPLPHGAWEQFSQRLDGLVPKPSPWKAYLAGGLAAATIGIGAYFLLPSAEEKQQAVSEQTTVAGNNTGTEQNISPASKGQPTGGNTTVYPTEGNTPVNTNVNGSNLPANHTGTGNKTVEKTDARPIDNNKISVNKTSFQNNNSNKNNDRKTLNSTPVNTNDTKGNEVHQPVNNQAPAAVQLPEPEISGNLREICPNTEVSFKAANVSDNHDITWILNGEEVSNETELKAIFSIPGTQTLQLVYSTIYEGKRISRESEKRILNILSAPVADMEVNKLNDYSPEYMFSAPAVEGNQYQWNFGDGKVQTGNDITHVYRKKGGYNIILNATGSNGCKNRKMERVEIESDYNLLAPNSFTPNGDGRNDVFIPEALKVMNDARFRMIIFDKSGKKIFETTRLDNPWDGRNATTGVSCAPDAYVWRVELTRADGTREDYMGSITILEN